MRISRRQRIWGALLAAALVLGGILVWNIGSVLIAPANHPVGAPPAGWAAQAVTLPSASGAMISGWWLPGEPGRGVVVLMHGVHADRRTMLDRAAFLSRAGYSVLLFDFQGHGESLGKRITFGFLESRDATAAVNFARQQRSGEKIGVIGVSLGAAAAALAEPPLPVDALVLESCYPTIYEATANRLADRFGFLGRLATPLLTGQMRLRLSIGLDDLKPIEGVRRITAPKLFIAGTEDRLTTLPESERLFAAAAEPKEFWAITGAGHQDLHAFAKAEYERRVLAFFAEHL